MNGELDGGLGQFNRSMESNGKMVGPNMLANVASLQPMARGNLMGSPLGNEGANMMPYLSMQEAFTPDMGTKGTSKYSRGGLAYADGGMPPPQGGAMEQGMPPGMGAAGGEGADPQLVQMVEQIFAENMQNPEMIAQKLVEFVMQQIEGMLTPEQKEQLRSPEGQQVVMQYLQQMMDQMGGLGQMAAGQEGGAAPPPQVGGLGQQMGGPMG